MNVDSEGVLGLGPLKVAVHPEDGAAWDEQHGPSADEDDPRNIDL